MRKGSRSFQRIASLTTVPVSYASSPVSVSGGGGGGGVVPSPSVVSSVSSQAVPIVVRQQPSIEGFVQRQPVLQQQRGTHPGILVVDRPQQQQQQLRVERPSGGVGGAQFSSRSGPVVVPSRGSVGSSVNQPVVVVGDDQQFQQRKRADRDWTDATLASKRARAQGELDEMEAEKERLTREISELRRAKDALATRSDSSGHLGSQSGHRAAAEQVVVVDSSRSETRRQQTWPLVLRRLLLAEQALQAEASKKSSRDKVLQQQLMRQQLQASSSRGEQHEASVMASLAGPPVNRQTPMSVFADADERRSLATSTAAALPITEESREVRVARLFTEVTRMLSNEFASCSQALPFLDSMLVSDPSTAGSDDAKLRGEVVLQIVTILIESCDYCRAAVVAGFPPKDGEEKTTSRVDIDFLTRRSDLHATKCSILTTVMSNLPIWIGGSDAPKSLVVVTVKFLRTILPCCTDDGVSAAVGLLRSPVLLSLLRSFHQTRNIEFCRDVLNIVRVFLRVVDLRVRSIDSIAVSAEGSEAAVASAAPQRRSRSQSSIVDWLCLLLRKQPFVLPNRQPKRMWSSDVADLPCKDNIDELLLLQHDVIRFLLTALSSCSRIQFCADGSTSSCTSSVPYVSFSQAQRGPPRVLLSYNYKALVDGVILMLNTTVSRYGSELPVHSDLICDVCDLLCLCSCNEDAFAAGYVSVAETPLFESAVCMLNKCVTPFQAVCPQLVARARRLTDLANQRTASSSQSQRQQQQQQQVQRDMMM